MKRYGTVDLGTGEMLEGAMVWVGVKRSPYGSRWYMSSQDAAIELAKDPVIGKSAETMRVLWYLVGRIDFENYLQIPQVEIADELDMKKENVHRAIKILLERGVLIRGPKVGRSSSWRLNPHYGWKGKVKNLNEERRKRLTVVPKDAERCDKTKDMLNDE